MEAAGAGEAVAMTAAATGALGPVIEKLGDLLRNEHMAALEGSRGDIEFIKSELEPLRSLLLRIWDKEDRLDAACKEWMAEARMLSYDMEDAIDGFRFMLAVEAAAATSPFEGMRNQVQELVNRCCEKQWITEAIIDADAPAALSSSPSLPRKNASELVEVDEKKAELIKLLKHKERVCIHGSAGMGKTTLAGLAYQAVSEQFDCRTFVSVCPSQSMMHVLTSITSEVIASAIIKAISDKQRELTVNNNTAPTTQGTGEADEQCLIDSILELLTYRRQVTDSSAPVAGTGIADGAKTDGSALPTTDTATLASTGIADTKTDGSSVALAGTGGIGDAKTESAPHAATGADNTKKALIDRISTRFVINKRKLNASAQLAGAGVDDDKQYLVNIVLKLLGEKRKVTDCAPVAGTTDVEDDEQYLVDILSQFLADQRYLVIVDDIWHCQQWEVIRKSLVKNDRGSRIIMTTRVNSVVEKCCKDDHAVVCEVTALSMDAAVALSEKIFNVHTAPSDKKSCSSIAKLSGRMPLAIICISAAVAQLLSPPSATNRFDVALCQALKGFAEIPCMKPLVESLVLGYHCLPPHLKTCLLECSIYTPNQRFERDDLIRIWMDEGFADEEQAPGYFEELVKWGYISISPAEGRRHSRVAEYEISAVVLAFLRFQAEEHGFVASAGYFSNIESLCGRRHSRISVQGGLGSWVVSRLDFSCMRTLVVFGRASLIPFDRLSHLRVLHLDEEDTSLEGAADLYNFPDLGDDDLVDICELLLLRYVKLKGCKITMLPPQIGQLKLLETLDVRGTGVRELPREIGELQRLKTLNVSNTAVTQVPKEIGKLHMLKTLDVSDTNVRELPAEIRELENLETLDVSNTMVAKLPREIRALQLLKTLHVSGIDVTETELAEEIGQLQHLETLDVSNTKVAKLPMEIWNLQQLKTLNISNTNVRELPWEAGQRSNSISVVAGNKDSPKVVNLLEGAVDNYGHICSRENISITLFDRFGSSWEPIPVARFKIPGKHISLPDWLNKETLSDISSLEINLWKLREDDLKILQEMPKLQVLALRVEVLPRTAITGAGFSRLESFCVDCRVPRLSFQNEAMPVLKHLQFKFYAFRATKQEPMGIVHLSSLRSVDFRCASGYTTDAPGIREIINQVRKEAKEHRNRITLCINTKEIVHDIVAGSTGTAGSSAVSVTDKKPEPTGNEDIIDNGNNISVRSSGLPEWIYFQ
ncbi:hypothetical protein DAI22_10g016300 [Oryza sativa Japonica Group]|nr:hypothetical protein DAI22_10g016300 [Oryza sativa Japonica Group]